MSDNKRGSSPVDHLTDDKLEECCERILQAIEDLNTIQYSEDRSAAWVADGRIRANLGAVLSIMERK